MRLRRALVTTVAVLAIPSVGTLGACSGGSDEYATAEVAEDCDVEDQANREDDCGYWQSPDGLSYRTGDQPTFSWIWIWYAWVNVGTTSVPPANWKAPHGLTHPRKKVTLNKKYCALALGEFRVAPQPPRPAPPAPRIAPPPAPRPPAGNAPGVNRPAPGRPPAHNPAKPGSQYKPPAGTKVNCR